MNKQIGFAEAMRLGAMLGPQLRDGRTLGENLATCAHGAALIALGDAGRCYAGSCT